MNQEENTDAAATGKADSAAWKLRLYVNGRTSIKSIVAMQNLNELCERYLTGGYDLEVIDLVENFAKAREDHIMALPTLVRRAPSPICKVIGDLSNTSQVLTALGLHGAAPPSHTP
jgi:circadian clock protein KaiB